MDLIDLIERDTSRNFKERPADCSAEAASSNQAHKAKVRREVLAALRVKPMSACELADALGYDICSVRPRANGTAAVTADCNPAKLRFANMPASEVDNSPKSGAGKAGTLEELFAKLEADLQAIGGCSDGYCVVAAPIGGMHTNGGCRCWQDKRTAQRLVTHTMFFRREAKRLLLETELRQYWPAFCDADPIPDHDGFLDRMERGGFITLRKVTKDDLSQPFASERGIEKGGMIWVLTNKGREAEAPARAAITKAGSGG